MSLNPLKWLKKTEKPFKKLVTADERANIRAMLEEGLSVTELREMFPDIQPFIISNIKYAIKKAEPKEAKVSVIAKEFTALAELQKAMVNTRLAERKAIKDEILAELPELEGDDTTDDRIVDIFLDVMKQRTAQPAQTVGGQSVSKPYPKPIPPAGAFKQIELSDDQLLALINEQVPPWLLKMISAGKFKKKQVFAWLVGDRGVEAAIFERAWKLIR